MAIRLTGAAVLELFCTAREAERSVDRALLVNWHDFLAYYSAAKGERLVGLVGRLRDLLPAEALVASPRTHEELVRELPRPGVFRLLFSRWLGRTRRAWTFRLPEIAFAVATLETLIQILKSPDRPSQDALIGLRMDLWMCEYLIECRCRGLPGLAEAGSIEHFLQARHVVPVRFEDLVSRLPQNTPVGHSP